MKIYHNIPENKNLFKNPVITIGNFDGVHLGHRKIFAKLLSVANKTDGDAIVITFSSHPRKILNPDIPIKVITSTNEKVNAIFNIGISNIILLHFTREMADMHADKFFNDILIKQIDIKEIVIGYDHAFGKNREGNLEFLTELTRKNGIGLTRVEEETSQSKPISSSWLRKEIEMGNMDMANKILGRPFSITGHVMRGEGRGSDLGFPTANIIPDDPDKILPADGAYAVEVLVENGIKKPAMMNIGFNPTFANPKRTIEVNIFDFQKDIYDKTISINIHHRIRDEKKFNSIDDLITQLNRDKEKTIKLLKY